MSISDHSLSPEEERRYEWQMWVPDLGVAGQCKLKGATVLISRVGGVGGTAALELAAAGVGRLILAHAGTIRLNDLNRQLLMTTEKVGSSRIASAAERLHALNPHVEIVPVAENIGEHNVAELVSQADLVIDAAPLFTERFLLNREAVRQGKPLVEAAMYDFEGQLFCVRPGETACLRCLSPEAPPHWRREFPVLGAVAGTMGALAAVEAIKILTGIGEPLFGRMLLLNLRRMTMQRLALKRDPKCPECDATKTLPPD